jgi:glutathione S-transferase
MTLALILPDNYGYVLLSSLVGQFVVSTYLGGEVMKCRKAFDVPYPNLYATPGFHKHADEFNRAQRGHQNMFETSGLYTVMSLITGLRYVCPRSRFSLQT